MYIHVPRILDNSVDLAVVEALRYGRCLRADELTALHFVIDADPAALLRRRWEYYELEKPLRVIDCPDRRLTRAAQELVWRARAEYRNTNVTVLLPRRGYAPLLGQVPAAAATIVPYDAQSRIRQAFPDPFEERITREVEKVQARITERDQQRLDTYDLLPQPPPAMIAVAGLIAGHLATVEGRVNEADDTIKRGEPVRVVVVGDDSGELRLTFSAGAAATLNRDNVCASPEGAPDGQPARLHERPLLSGHPGHGKHRRGRLSSAGASSLIGVQQRT
jgi:hypothetical protein